MAVTNNKVRLLNDAVSRAKPDVDPMVNYYTQDRYPFLSMFFGSQQMGLSPEQQKFMIPGIPRIKQSSTYNFEPKLYYFTDTPSTYVSQGAETGLTTLVALDVDFDDNSGLKKYDLLQNRTTGAVVMVNSTSGATSTNVTPVWGGTGDGGADNIADNAVWDYIGPSYPDGATLNNGIINEPTAVSNYIQAFVHEVDVGFIAEHLDNFPNGKSGEDEDRMTQFYRHQKSRESAFLFGNKQAPKTVSGALHHAMGGLLDFSTNSYDAGGSLTMDEIRGALMTEVVAGGGGDKSVVAGSGVMNELASILDAGVQTRYGEDMIGSHVMKVQTPSGNLRFFGSEPMDTRVGEFITFNPATLERKYVENLDTTYVTDLAPNNVLKKTSAWITVETLLAKNPEDICHITNASS